MLPKIISFTGVSGTGKSTIVEELLKDNTFQLLTSTTTRPKREHELKGEYEHVSIEEFKQLKEESAFLWTAHYAGNYYGTKKEFIDNALASDKISLIILVPETVPVLLNYAKESVLPIFIRTPSKEMLLQRMQHRHEGQEVINKRMQDVGVWETQARDSNIPYAYIKNEGTIKQAVDNVNKIISTHLRATSCWRFATTNPLVKYTD